MKAARTTRQPLIVVAGILIAVIGVLLVRRKPDLERGSATPKPVASGLGSVPTGRTSAPQATNNLGDLLVDGLSPEFTQKVFPVFRNFADRLKQLGLSPLESVPSPESCGKIRVINTPQGIICTFTIGDRWTADYVRNGSYEGIGHFGQRGPDNPFRAISRADTEALLRLSKGAVDMPQAEAWKIAERIESAFGIDRARFESPQMHEESLFEYHLGMHTVRYRGKGTEPLNQMNYTRSFTLKATSKTTAVLIRYSNMDGR